MAMDLLGRNGDQLRRLDRDRYLTCLFAPADRRPALFALYAFNLELARVRDAVTQPILGRIRLQWWRDAVADLYQGTVRRHPVTEGLAAAIGTHGLSQALFDRAIDAREADLDDDPPETLAALSGYGADTAGSLLILHLEILGERGEAARAAARHVGIATALAGSMRSIPWDRSRRHVRMPRDVAATAGLDLADLASLRPPEALSRAVKAVCDAASVHLAQARSLCRGIPRKARPALLAARLADIHLYALARNGYDPFCPDVAVTRPRAPLVLAIAHLRGRY
jgi:NADH dehydrogenase [ubiquinone] 1 alpha subcomplex assembly factor 6